MSEKTKPEDEKSKETKDPPWQPDLDYPAPLRENEATAGGPGGTQTNPPGKSHR